MKKYLFFIATALTIASCSSDEFVGVDNADAQKRAIVFSGATPNPQRAQKTGSEAASLLGNQFCVYGTKTVGTDTYNVFAQNGLSATDNTPYYAWYDGATSSSNTSGWEYVGVTGTTYAGGVNLTTDQTIKYWDYAATAYDFIAYTSNGGTVSNVTMDGFKFTGTPTQLQSLKVADKKLVEKSAFNAPVQFVFRAAGSKARVGIYETIPGYDVRDVMFRYTSGGTEAEDTKAILNGSFLGGTDEFESNVTFAADGKALIAQGAGSITTVEFTDFGALTYNAAGELGTTGTEAAYTGYVPVIPNSDNTGDMTLYVNYTLVNDQTGETITVTGAKAIVPASAMVWQNNYAYTYLFKISDQTSGTTGVEGADPAGLYPITFDAVVEEETVAGSVEHEEEVED